jgi:hypothetical protein
MAVLRARVCLEGEGIRPEIVGMLEGWVPKRKQRVEEHVRQTDDYAARAASLVFHVVEAQKLLVGNAPPELSWAWALRAWLPGGRRTSPTVALRPGIVEACPLEAMVILIFHIFRSPGLPLIKDPLVRCN